MVILWNDYRKLSSARGRFLLSGLLLLDREGLDGFRSLVRLRLPLRGVRASQYLGHLLLPCDKGRLELRSQFGASESYRKRLQI